MRNIFFSGAVAVNQVTTTHLNEQHRSVPSRLDHPSYMQPAGYYTKNLFKFILNLFIYFFYLFLSMQIYCINK